MSNNIELNNMTTHKPKLRSASVDHINGHIKPILRQAETHSSLRNSHGISKMENITEENEKQNNKMLTLSVKDLTRKHSTHSVYTNKSNTIRESSRSQKSLNSNHTYAENQSDADVMSYRSKYSSNQSLSTIKEQYCCTPECRFTPRERKLCAVVGVLATIIVILVIVVGFLASQKGGETRFYWSL